MKVRIGLVLATAVIISASGCASGGGGSSSGAAAVPTLPGGTELPEGIRPRDNNHTRSADLYVTQAMAASDPAQQAVHYREALQAALDGMEADPENPKSHFQAGQANVGLKNFDDAAANFDRAEELHPRYRLETVPWREQGWVDAYNAAIGPMNAGDLDTAALLFNQANALYPERPEAFLQLGSLLARNNEVAGSIEAFQTAMGILEESHDAQMLDSLNAISWTEQWEIATLGLGQAFTLGERWQDAADLYGQLLAEDPGNSTLVGNLASVLSELAMPDSVQALYDQLLSDPNLGEADFFNAGVGLYQIENWALAAEAFGRAADMNSFNRDARLNQAQTFMIAEMWEEAIVACEALREVDPLNSNGWLWEARAHSELGNDEQASAIFLEFQAIGYHVDGISLQGLGEGGARITGQLVNVSAEPGQTLTLRFVFGGVGGQELGSVEVSTQVPAVEMRAVFAGDFANADFVTGYRYEVVR